MIRFFFLAILLFPFISRISRAEEIWLKELDAIISNRHEYKAHKNQRITRQKQQLCFSKKDEDIFLLQGQLYKEYEKYLADSALYYLEKNLYLSERSGNENWLIRTYIDLLHQYTSMGNYEECIALYNKLKERSIPKQLLIDFYSVSEFLFSELRVSTRIESNKEYYKDLQNEYRKLFFELSGNEDERVIKLKEWDFVHQGEPEKALELNNKRCQMVTTEHPEYACVYFDRAMIEQILGNTKQMKLNLALSAINDLMRSTRDNASLLILAQALHEEGDLKRAFLYGKVAEEDAQSFAALKRSVQVARIMPGIEKKFREKLDQQRRYLAIALLIIGILSISSAFNLYLLKKRKKKILVAHDTLKKLHEDQSVLNTRLQQINQELNCVNHIKEEYIGRYLSLYSFYIDKLNQHRREVVKSIVSGSIPDLLKRMKSNEQPEEDVRDFYHLFDQSIVAIFPHFVEEFNALINDDCKVEPRKGEILSVELRIFALIRLGINDSAQIARLLRYSVNTIYNYRAKVKNKTIVPRDEFEQYIMKIGVIES